MSQQDGDNAYKVHKVRLIGKQKYAFSQCSSGWDSCSSVRGERAENLYARDLCFSQLSSSSLCQSFASR